MIAGIVILYNSSVSSMENIKTYALKVDRLIVLDNSEEDNLVLLKTVLKEVEFIYRCFEKNIGLCAALNFGMSLAKEYGCDWALIMDDDTQLVTDVVAVYREAMRIKEPTVAVWAPVHLHDRSKKRPYEGTTVVKWAMTSGCLYHVEIAFKLGRFMEELFVDGLDIEYCYKARKNSYQIIECGQAVVKHHPAQSKTIFFAGREILKYGIASPWRYFMQSRSLMYLILKYKESSVIIQYLWKWFKVLFLFCNKIEYIKQMQSGTMEGIKLYTSK